MRILVVCVGRVREPFADDSAHYERLLGRQAKLEAIELKEAGLDPRRAAEAIAGEGAELLRRIPSGSHCCALDRSGRELASEQWAEFVEQRRASGRDICFVIGGPFGLAGEVLDRADHTISLGKLTLPHQLARVVLLEQLFRAHKIIQREKYHY